MAAAVQCLMSLVAILPDTNLLYRGGAGGLRFATAAARGFLAAGGVHSAGWEIRAQAIDRFTQAMDQSVFIGGKAVEEFEKNFAAFCHAQYCVGTDSGTSPTISTERP